MKTTIGLLSLLLMNTVMADIEATKAIQDNGTLTLKNKSTEILLIDTDARFDLLTVDNTLVVKFNQSNKVFALATFEENSENDNFRTSINNVTINVLVDKEDKKFKGTLCSHMGCVPFPHFDKTLRQLVEIETLDGTILCYNNKAIEKQNIWTIGNCVK